MIDCLNWEDSTFDWDNNDYTWDEVCTVSEVVNEIVSSSSGGFLGIDRKRLDKLDSKTKDDFITLVIRVKQQKYNIYNDAVKIQKEKENYTLDLIDVQLTIKEVINVSVRLENNVGL